MTRTPEPRTDNCFGCKHDADNGRGPCALDVHAVNLWTADHCDTPDGTPTPGAPPCPGFAPRTPAVSEAGERAERLGDFARLTVDGIDFTHADEAPGPVAVPTPEMVANALAALADTPLAMIILRSRIAHLERALKAERGEGEPREGWRPSFRGGDLRWVRTLLTPGEVLDAVRHKNTDGPGTRWHWWRRTVDRYGEVVGTISEGRCLSALEAIAAAEAALALSGREGA